MITNANNHSPRLVIVGDYLFDPGVGLISGPSGAHYVCPQLASVLDVLVENAGSVVSPEESPALPRLVARLKGYFDDHAYPPTYIETVPNKGYRLVAPVYGSTEQPALKSENQRDNRVKSTVRLGGLINEFRDRKVCRAMLIYSAVIWLIFEITGLVSDALALPEWIFPVVVYLGIIGFPIAALLSWLFDLTPDGIVRDRHRPVQPSPGRKKTELAMDFTLVLAAIAICFLLVFSSHTGGTPEADTATMPVPNSESVYENRKDDVAHGAADYWAG